MNRMRLAYTAGACALGFFLLGLGGVFSNFYMVVLGIMIVASSLATLTMPRP